MSDTVIKVKDAKTGAIFPIKARDCGDGTFDAGPIIFLQSPYSKMTKKRSKMNIIRRH